MNCIVIGIAGGSGSGKSTFTKRLLDLYKDKIAVIYHDNYYKKQDNLSPEERKKTNYDHPDSLDTKMLVEHIRKLKEGEAIDCPIYVEPTKSMADIIINSGKNEVAFDLIRTKIDCFLFN